MPNKINESPPQAIEVPQENGVHIAGEHGAETTEYPFGFNATQIKARSDLGGKCTVEGRSSPAERPVHIGNVGGSIPSAPTGHIPLAGKLTKPGVADRFWSKVNIAAPDKCWEWQGAKKKGNYQACHFKVASYVTVSATRCAYTLATGEDPGVLWVLHHCDNPLCCNPSHLYLGTVKDNAADAKARNRYNPPCLAGPDNPRAKMTAEQVEHVRALFAQGKSNVAIGQLLGVHHSTISKIRTGATWK